MHVGELYKHGRYRVLQKLGWGHFSTVWLVRDNETGQHSALKVCSGALPALQLTAEVWPLSSLPLPPSQVQKSAKHYTEAARDEIQLLSEIRDGDAGPRQQYCVQLRDSFEHSGPHGTHMCMVFEVRVHVLPCPAGALCRGLMHSFTCLCCPWQVLGDNLLALIKAYNYRGIPLHLVKRITQQASPGSHAPGCLAPEQALVSRAVPAAGAQRAGLPAQPPADHPHRPEARERHADQGPAACRRHGPSPACLWPR